MKGLRIGLVGEEQSQIWLGQRRFDLVVRLRDDRRDTFEAIRTLLIDGHVHEVAVDEEADAIVVTIHGQRHRVLVRSPLEKVLRDVHHAGPATSGEVIESPIPGLVVALKVKPGDTVAAGQAVVVVEAMKMQNELTAERGGIVEAVHVSERQTVESGAKLVTLKPAPAAP